MFTSTFAGMLAGFGLFFVGVWTLTENLKQMSGRRLRQAVLKHTRRPTHGFFWGTIVGALAQSLTATVFILVGMISAGILSMRVAMPILAGANVGSSMLVFLSTINLEVAVLFVLGISGIVMTLVDRDWLRPVMHGLFGLGLLFLGISFIQSNAAPLVQTPWIEALFTDSKGSYVTIFVVGLVMCVIAQSVSAVTILAISLGQAGILTTDLTILAVYGANFGSGIVTLVLGVNLRGAIRQIALYQIISGNFLATTLFVIMWIVEVFFGVPLIKALLAILADDIAGQMAFLYLLLCGPIVLSLFFLPWAEGTLARMSPPTQTEKDAQPNYIIHAPVSNVDAALEAAQQDQNRLIVYLGKYFENLQAPLSAATNAAMSEAFETLSTELDYYLDDLGHEALNPKQLDRLNKIAYRQKVLRSLATTVSDCTRKLDQAPGSTGMERFVKLLQTSLETTVLTSKSAFVDKHTRDLERLAAMVGDRSEVLSKMRYAYLTQHVVEDRQERMRLVQMTVAAERIFWGLDMLRKTFHMNDAAAELEFNGAQSA